MVDYLTIILQGTPSWFWTLTALAFGAIVGSFLNVCIYRMPRDLSIVHPSSHCGSCQKSVRWHDNIPVFSYLILRGRCRHCHAPYSMRYMLVEILTALLFAWIWKNFSWTLALPYTVFVCGLIVGTFTDFDFLIIPNEITWGGVFVGIILSGLFPGMQNMDLHWQGAVKSFISACVGYGSLWMVVELGKLAFGTKKLELSKSSLVEIHSDYMLIENEKTPWEEIFSRESDVLRFEATQVQCGDRSWDQAVIRVRFDSVQINEEKLSWEKISGLKAMTQALFIPREAMGFGDVKLLAAIGAFLGLQAIFFVVLTASLIGSVVGMGTMLIGQRGWGLKIPFGPYLALASLLWIAGGHEITRRYFEWLCH